MMPPRSVPSRVAEALASLDGSGVPVDKVAASDSRSPGLYAVYAAARTWCELGLGKPPDERPLYIGKAEATLASRDLQGHFGMRPRGTQSPTGSSTLRRSLAALLASDRGYRAIPRNPTTPGHFSNYGLSAEQDDDLSAWMRRQLRLALWPHANSAALDAVERAVLERILPPLNLNTVLTPWRDALKAARKRMADDARGWTIS